jgi:parallel beta-helix repeat protein
LRFKSDFHNALILLALVSIFSVPVLLCSQGVAVKTDTSIIRVPHDFPTIQDAVNAAQNGSTILVDSGTYYEHVTINKTLTLLGADEENTIIDGYNSGTVITLTAGNVLINGFTVRNSSTGISADGILLEHSSGSIISGNIITLCGGAGIRLDDSTDNTVSGNVVSSTIGNNVGVGWGDGIYLRSSANNTISDNLITDSTVAGVKLDSSTNNTIFGNTIQNNYFGIGEPFSGYNVFFNNNLLRNYIQAFVNTSDVNTTDTWSIGGRGNYWDDYTGLDDGSGGRVAGDGVGDTNIPWHSVDYCPLINPVDLQVFWNNTAFPVSVVSNSTVSAFNFVQASKIVGFNVNGPANTTGYFNVSMPTALLSGPWRVLLDGTDMASEAVISENQTYTSIYLNYSHSIHSVQLVGTYAVPEYPTATSPPLIMLITLALVVFVAVRRKRTRPDINS